MEITGFRIIPDNPEAPFIQIIVNLQETEIDQLDPTSPLQSAEFYVWIPKTVCQS